MVLTESQNTIESDSYLDILEAGYFWEETPSKTPIIKFGSFGRSVIEENIDVAQDWPIWIEKMGSQVDNQGT